jgi:hypothetical protein
MYGLNLNKMKSYFCPNPDRPSRIQRLRIDFFIRLASTRRERPGRHGHEWWGSPNSGYGTQGKTRFLPTWSKSQEGLILQTYGLGNSWWRAGDDGAVRSSLGDGEGCLRRSSGSKVCSGGGDASEGSCFKCWFSMRMLQQDELMAVTC